VEATPPDIEAARLLGLVYVEHALRQATLTGSRYGVLPDMEGVGGPHRMQGDQRAFLDALPTSFTSAEAEEAGEDVGVSRATTYRWLKALCDAGLLRWASRGQYEKPRPERETIETNATIYTLDTREGGDGGAGVSVVSTVSRLSGAASEASAPEAPDPWDHDEGTGADLGAGLDEEVLR
jgi:hypothetical protein